MAGSISSRAEDPPPQITQLTVTNQQKSVGWKLLPHIGKYELRSTTNLADGFGPDATGRTLFTNWTGTNAFPQQFFQVQVQPLDSNALLTAQVLNRLGYGPTPDELERIIAIGPQAYISEQLAPESITESLDDYTTVTTNSTHDFTATNWVRVAATGRATSSNLYVYLTAPGEVYLDQLRLVSDTNPDAGTNVLVNGDFESALSPAWNVSTNLALSQISAPVAFSGNSGLHLICTSPGSNQATAMWQTFASPFTNNEVVTLSYWYLPTSNSHALTIRLSSSSTVSSGDDLPEPPSWVYAQATGVATSTRTFYLYLSGSGEAYIDDLKLVEGTSLAVETNLLQNAGFESGLNPWRLAGPFTNSVVSSTIAHSGSASLKVVASAAGSGSGSSVFQTNVPGIVVGRTYTLGFWYVPATRGRTLTARLAGSGTVGLLQATPDTQLSGIRRRLDTQGAQLQDLRAWFVQNAVGSRRQLLEVLTQFLENHFVTQHGKSVDYFDRYYDDTTLTDRLAADWEYREITKWRAALMQPDCTFYDLLKISAESPAMIVYLDTVDSRGDARNIANENYARELFELFCMGVDNGYDQYDIVAQSRAWTGWSVDIVEARDRDNPFAPQSTVYGAYPGNGLNSISNRVGVWSFRFKSERHGTNRAPMLSVWSTNSTSANLIPLGPKIVPARFGPPWSGTPYQLSLPRRTGTNGIADGYDVLRHLANLPFTMEYISVKLCRWFVHDNFPNPTTNPNLPEYTDYDYTSPHRSPEADLVHQCMLAWWNSNPRGQIRPVLATIFNSELFRTRQGALHKVKTPIEFAIGTVRALRALKPDGTYTAGTDGYSLTGTSRTAGSSPLSRMGRMLLFDRDSPDGYPETASPWISSGTLAERTRFVQTTLMASTDTNKLDGMAVSVNRNVADPVALLKLKLPAARWNNAGDVADFFLRLLFPAEGRANLDLYKQAALAFLDTADNGVTSSPFAHLGNTTAAYDLRVRGLAAMLMTLPRFQEQ